MPLEFNELPEPQPSKRRSQARARLTNSVAWMVEHKVTRLILYPYALFVNGFIWLFIDGLGERLYDAREKRKRSKRK